MAEQLLSLGLDVGTTTTQLVLSRLTVENQASAFTVPKMEITQRQVIYRSPIRFTPLIREELVDGEAIARMVEEEYRAAGIDRAQVDTGAVIITGETSRKENAASVLAAVSGMAGEFVVATAGPDLESVLAAKGAGAASWSEKSGRPVLHMDIGGGTSNLALIEKGEIKATACLNVGGRLVKLEGDKVSYVSPVLAGLTDIAPGQSLTRERARPLARKLAEVLEMAAGLRPRTEDFYGLTTGGTVPLEAPADVLLSFSGGVAACMECKALWNAYGDLGPLLAEAILESRLCQGDYRLGEETIRATVIGAGCHSAQLSGSTVFCENVDLPLKNLPVASPGENETAQITAALEGLDGPGVLWLETPPAPSYAYVSTLADRVAGALGDRPCYIALRADMAKALGGALRLRLGESRPILCIDSVDLPAHCYLDVGRPVGPALPVVVKTLAFG